MRDEIGIIPKIKNTTQALKEIIKITQDKRSHIMLQDCVEWLELKMKVIKIIAQKRLNTHQKNKGIVKRNV